MNWTDYFYNIAQQVKEKSKDERTKVGAVIVGKDKEIVSTGYNSYPRGIVNNRGDNRLSIRGTLNLNLIFVLNNLFLLSVIKKILPPLAITSCIFERVFS